MTYSIYNLASSILEYYNNEFQVFKQTEFDFDNAVVSVTGMIGSEYGYDGGDWANFVAPTLTLICRWANIDMVVVSYNDESEHEFTIDELQELELKLWT